MCYISIFDMFRTKKYKNFVKAASPSVETTPNIPIITPVIQLSGDEAKRIYIEEVKDVIIPVPTTDEDITDLDNNTCSIAKKQKRKKEKVLINNKELFLAVQNNKEDLVKQMLDDYPEKLNIIDEFGWSLLMIACQANSVVIVKDLLERGITTSVRDKAGNSALSLVIRNKNIALADLLLGHRQQGESLIHTREKHKRNNHPKEEFECNICKNVFTDKEQHLSSTIHNINASKGKKIAPCYRIPETNRGYQIMLKTGWDKDTGLGFSGSGIKYPIKPVQKKDRKGLGHAIERRNESQNVDNNLKNKTIVQSHNQRKRNMEIRFRREFY